VRLAPMRRSSRNASLHLAGRVRNCRCSVTDETTLSLGRPVGSADPTISRKLQTRLDDRTTVAFETGYAKSDSATRLLRLRDKRRMRLDLDRGKVCRCTRPCCDQLEVGRSFERASMRGGQNQLSLNTIVNKVESSSRTPLSEQPPIRHMWKATEEASYAEQQQPCDACQSLITLGVTISAGSPLISPVTEPQPKLSLRAARPTLIAIGWRTFATSGALTRRPARWKSRPERSSWAPPSGPCAASRSSKGRRFANWWMSFAPRWP
jgi:hypothetical protein